MGGRRRDRAELSRRRRLALRQAINTVIHDYGRYVYVPVGGRGNVLGTDRKEVTITGDNYGVQVRSAHLYTKGNWQGAAVNSVNAEWLVAFDKVNHVSGTTDSCYYNILGLRLFMFY